MKTIRMLVLMAAAVGAQAKEADIVVFLQSNHERSAIIGVAERQATRILASAGISVQWRSGEADYHGHAEVIEAVLTRPDQNYKPAALASAELGVQSGTRIEVFYNRIAGYRRREDVAPLLAHVLAHEIVHIVEGQNRHSDTGIMKARWDGMDRELMRANTLPFADEDLRMIHAWVERHNRIHVAGMRPGQP